MISDNELKSIYNDFASKIVANRRSALTKLYAHFSPLVYRKLRYKFRSISEAELEDLVQDAFIKMMTTSSAPQGPESLPSWVLTVAANAALDLLRDVYRKNELPLSSLDESDEENPAPGVQIAVPAPESRDAERCVSEGISKFALENPDRASAIRLLNDGISMRDMARLMNHTEAGMRQYIYESKKKLKPYIERCLEFISEAKYA